MAPWLGDLMYWARLRGLADGAAPLIVMEGVFPAEQLSLTTLGEAVARGEADWLWFAAPAEFEARRHRGGVEIVPSQAHWRCGRDGAPAGDTGTSAAQPSMSIAPTSGASSPNGLRGRMRDFMA